MTKPGKRLTAALGLAAILVTLAGGGTASATRGLATGFSDQLYGSPDPNERSLWFDRTVQANASLVRFPVAWSTAAPSPPADPGNPASYNDLGFLDAVVREARARGLTVMLTVNSAPSWAEGPGRPASADPGTWKPNPAALAAFMRALALRYSGSFDADGPGG